MDRKRPASSVAGRGVASKRNRSSAVSVGSSRGIKKDPDALRNEANGLSTTDKLKAEFIELLSDPALGGSGVSNQSLKAHFGTRHLELVPIINELTRQNRLSMSKLGGDLFYSLVSEDLAAKFSGLDASARLVYQVIERSGNKGIWTKDIRIQTNLQQQALTKMYKALESRRLIKPVKSVQGRSKKIYMLYNLQPAKEITGGPWYTELEFDHEFISELRMFILLCVRRLNGGRGVSLSEIAEKMKQAKVSKVNLNIEEVQQLVQTLAYDFQIEQASSGTNAAGEALFVAARKVTVPCEFKWWDVLEPDFHFRDIVFEDGVTLKAHEPHHHTA